MAIVSARAAVVHVGAILNRTVARDVPLQAPELPSRFNLLGVLLMLEAVAPENLLGPLLFCQFMRGLVADRVVLRHWTLPRPAVALGPCGGVESALLSLDVV